MGTDNLALKTNKELLDKVASYRDNPNFLPAAVAEELLKRIDKSYKLIGVVDIGREGLILLCLDSLQTKFVIKIAIFSETKRKNFTMRLGNRFFSKETENEFVERFKKGLSLQGQVNKKIAEDRQEILVVPGLRRVSQDPFLYGEMEFIDGITVLRWIKEKKSIRYAITRFLALLDCVGYLHGYGIVFRDLKSAHIYQTSKDRLAILDWTMAKTVGDRNLTADTAVMGTVPLMSPKLKGGGAKYASYPDDIFALGFIYYEWLQAESLPELLEYKEEGKEQEYINYLASLLPHQVRPIFIKSTQLDEEKRYQAASEMRIDVTKLLAFFPEAESLPTGPQAPDPIMADLCSVCTNQCKKQLCQKLLESLSLLRQEGLI